MKSFMRRSKTDKSTLRRIEIILRRGYYKRNRKPVKPVGGVE